MLWYLPLYKPLGNLKYFLMTFVWGKEKYKFTWSRPLNLGNLALPLAHHQMCWIFKYGNTAGMDKSWATEAPL